MPRKQNKKLIRVVQSPFKEDDNLPWDYAPDHFCRWVWEVFLVGYKYGLEIPDLQTAMGHLRSMGFIIKIIDEKDKSFNDVRNQLLCNEGKPHDESRCNWYH